MTRRVGTAVLLGGVLGLGAALWAQRPGVRTITAAEAKNHIGETATVCGKVVSANYAAQSPSRPTFLYLDQPYPGEIFMVLIWGWDRAKFGEPEKTYRDKSICVTGRIKEYMGVPEVVASQRAQIKIRSDSGK